jgi:hypothetical protein
LIRLLFIIQSFLILLISCQPYVEPGIISKQKKNKKEYYERQKGVHVFGSLDTINIQPLKETNFNWVTLVPYGDQKDYDSAEFFSHKGDSLRVTRRNNRMIKWIETAHKNGFKVFVKPHIWLYENTPGKWRSDIYPKNEESWQNWQKDYRQFILRYARLAELSKVEMFCVGTELSRLATEKTEFWEDLIQDVRKIYGGKITYAANWHNEYQKITFWEDLDYIGIQAYFPLVKNENPSILEISKGWKKHISAISSVHKKYNRPVLFTEMGYKSTPDSAIRPWEWIDYEAIDEIKPSNETQANCYRAFFDTVWDMEWMAGIHIWQWRSNPGKRRGNKRHLDFTPQGKPAELIIKSEFLTE